MSSRSGREERGCSRGLRSIGGRGVGGIVDRHSISIKRKGGINMITLL